MGRFARALFGLALGLCTPVVDAAGQQPPIAVAMASTSSDLRTFVVEKPPAEPTRSSGSTAGAADPGSATHAPPRHDTLRTTFGAGYVQGADWGAETVASGAGFGLDVQLESLFTKGTEGLKFDHGTLRLSQPDNGWRAEAGDLFSSLAGPARGGRVSWLTATGREPALSFYGVAPGSVSRPAIVSYRDQLRVHGQTLFDAEIGSDRSHLLRSRLSSGRVELEATYRRVSAPVASREAGAQASAVLWRGVGVGAGFSSIDERHQRAASMMIMVRLRPSRFLALSIERAVATTGGGVNAATAATATVAAGPMNLLHRYQWGVSRVADHGLRSALEREQFQSFASYASGPRFSISLQTATEWRDSGRMPQWQELRTTVRLARDTRLQLAAAVPHLADDNRLRVQLTQGLSRRYALQVEYGRPAAYQSLWLESSRPRIKLMLQHVVNVSTPRRGGEVRGRIVDELARPVAAARVTLGPYTTDSRADGTYLFRDLPRGEYDLALDESHLPADYAWDGRRQRLAVLPSSRLQLDLVVAPLNAIHGRVFADRNANGRFDEGEAVAGVVLHVQDRATMTDGDGAYSFYNLWPGAYVIRLDAARLPASLEAAGATELAVTLVDGRPVTGADFLVAGKAKAIIWKEIR